MQAINNATPRWETFGTDDESIKQVPVLPIEVPLHAPKFFGFFEKGPTNPELVDGGKLLKLYGDKWQDPKSKYYTHSSKFLQDIIGTGNNVVVQRVLPPDVKTVANMTIYIDYVKDKIKKYKRNADGSIVKDSTGNKVEDTDSPIDGYRIKIIKEVNTEVYGTEMGAKVSKPGYMVAEDGSKSTMVPILEFRAKYMGEYYNNVGIAMDLELNKNIDPNFISKTKALPFNIYMYTKDKDDISPKLYKDKYNAVKNVFSFKQDAVIPDVNIPLDINSSLSNWYNTQEGGPRIYPLLDDVYQYTNNLELVLDKLYETEKPYINAMFTTATSDIVNTENWFDFINDKSAEDNRYLINFLNGYSSKRVFYFSIAVDRSQVNLADNHAELYMVNNIPTFLGNGTDGDLTNENYEKAVRSKMDEYLDENSRVMDMATNPESILYDTGFSLETKLKLVNFIVNRKDTFLVLSTFIKGKPTDIQTQRAVGIALKSRLQLAPESVHFNTGVARAMVVMGYGRITNEISRDYFPQTYDIAIKSAKMMGGQKWKKELLFSKGKDNVIKSMYDLKPDFIPQGVNVALWDAGIVSSRPYDLERYFFPALQTIYDNDTSILNNYFNALAIGIINRVAYRIWSMYTGVTDLSPAELIDEVEKEANSELKDVTAGVLTIIPKAAITNYDSKLGYSWTMVFKLGGNVSKTVMLSYIVAMRQEDLQ